MGRFVRISFNLSDGNPLNGGHQMGQNPVHAAAVVGLQWGMRVKGNL